MKQITKAATKQLAAALKGGQTMRQAIDEINQDLPEGEQLTYLAAYRAVRSLYTYYADKIDASKTEQVAKEIDNLAEMERIQYEAVEMVDHYLNIFDEELSEQGNAARKTGAVARMIGTKTNCIAMLLKIADTRMRLLDLYEITPQDAISRNIEVSFNLDEDPAITKLDD